MPQTDGYLALGGAETTLGLTTRFRPEATQSGLYRPVAPFETRPAEGSG